MTPLDRRVTRLRWELEGAPKEFCDTVLMNPFIIHEPTPKEAEFCQCTDKEVLYGGAAGGGKSEALLMAALQYTHVPEYSALLLRRSYADLSLPGALMDRAREWLTNKAEWRALEKRWLFPSGATLTFGYLDKEGNEYRYQSSEYQFIGFDELTQFSERQYTYLFSRLRRLAKSNIPIRMRSATNPGGRGHDWVKARFLLPSPDEMKGFERRFIPARLEDNPHIDQMEYEKSLNALTLVRRQQLRLGDWSVSEAGGYFKREFIDVIESPPPMESVVRYWDLAGTEARAHTDPDWTVGAKVGKAKGVFYVLDVRRMRENPGAVEALVRQTAQLDGKDVAIRMEQEPGSSGKSIIDHYARFVLEGFNFVGVKTTGSKTDRAKPVAAACANRNLKLMSGTWAYEFLDELEAFPEASHDDQVDALSGAFNELTQHTRPAVTSAASIGGSTKAYKPAYKDHPWEMPGG